MFSPSEFSVSFLALCLEGIVSLMMLTPFSFLVPSSFLLVLLPLFHFFAGILTYDAPIEADGTSEPAVLEVLIEDPEDRNNRILSAYVNMPPITSTGTRTVLNVTTTMRMVDDRAVHLFLGDLLVSETITTWIRGEIELTAHVPVCKLDSWFVLLFLLFGTKSSK